MPNLSHKFLPKDPTSRIWWIFAIGAIVSTVGVFCSPLFYQIENYGVRDWDQQLFYYGSVLKSIFEYGQVPLWNPWYCGGSVLFQHPLVPVVSPVYILEPFLGLLLAMKLTIAIHYALALFGLTLVATKIYKLSNILSIILASTTFVFSSYLSLRVAEGHSWVLTAAYIPFVYLGFEI